METEDIVFGPDMAEATRQMSVIHHEQDQKVDRRLGRFGDDGNNSQATHGRLKLIARYGSTIPQRQRTRRNTMGRQKIIRNIDHKKIEFRESRGEAYIEVSKYRKGYCRWLLPQKIRDNEELAGYLTLRNLRLNAKEEMGGEEDAQ